jgi:hypothetical protein
MVMKEIVILSTQRAGALDEGKGAFVEVETNEGPCQIRFTAEDAERLVVALRDARKQLQAERVKAGTPPAPLSRTPERWETAVDPVEQTVIVRTDFSDGSSEQTRIPRTQIARVIRVLEQALKRFEAGAEMRQ